MVSLFIVIPVSGRPHYHMKVQWSGLTWADMPRQVKSQAWGQITPVKNVANILPEVLKVAIPKM